MTKDRLIPWAKAAAVRAVRTMAQTAVAMLPVAATVQQVDWLMVAGTAALSGIVSVLTALAGLPEVKETDHEQQ